MAIRLFSLDRDAFPLNCAGRSEICQELCLSSKIIVETIGENLEGLLKKRAGRSSCSTVAGGILGELRLSLDSKVRFFIQLREVWGGPKQVERVEPQRARRAVDKKSRNGSEPYQNSYLFNHNYLTK
jgi:hypothetical protein